MNYKSNVIVLFSGGKDSTLCLALALKHYHNVIALFNDTGWEHPVTYQYIETLENHFNIKVHRTNYTTLEEEILKVKEWPTGVSRYCTKELKQRAFARYYDEELLEPNKKYEVWLGIRTGESYQRSQKYKSIVGKEYYEPEIIFPKQFKKKVAKTFLFRFPIIDIQEHQVYLWLKKLKVPLNPLYYEGSSDRVGCYPCLLASKNKQKAMLETEFGLTRQKKLLEIENKIGRKYEMYDVDNKCEFCKT